MEVTKKLNIYYRNYSWLDLDKRVSLTSEEYTETENQILVGTTEVTVNVVDYETYPDLLKARQIAILQKQQKVLREKTIKELQELEEKIQTLLGIEYNEE